MKHFHLTQHDNCCKNNDWCFTDSTLFSVKGEFIIVEYSKCLMGYSQVDFNLNLIKQVLGKCYTTPIHKLEKSIHLCENWKNSKKREMIYLSKHREVNYIYFDNAGKMYSINTVIDFGEAVEITTKILTELNEFKSYAKENNLTHLIDSANLIASYNYISKLKDEEIIVRSINEIITNINNQI